MSKVVKIGYVAYMDKDDERTDYRRVELRVHVYDEYPPGYELPFWSVWHYYDKEGTDISEGQYFKDFQTADLRFHDRRPLDKFSVGAQCPKCGHKEAMHEYRILRLRCLKCGNVWSKK